MKGIKRLFNSSKAVTSMMALQMVIGVQYLGWEAETVRIVAVAIVTLACVYMGSTSYEDKGNK